MDLTKLLRVMKLTAFLLLAVCLQVSATGSAQGITLRVKDKPLEEVFTEIKRQTGYVVFYEYSVIKESRSVTLNVRNATVEQFLRECFKDQPLDYSIEGKTILVTKRNVEKNEEALAPPPPINIKGKVVNENGEPVAVSILVKGTNRGTTNKPTGDFELNDVDENATLVITGVSIEPLEIKVNGKTDLGVIAAKLKVTGLGEVIINKGYYTEKQKFSTGNVGRVSAKEIERQPVLNVLSAMTGRIAGVSIIQETGTPGGGFTVRVRGTNSMFSGKDPLYVIDGVPISGKMEGVSVTSGNLFAGGGAVNLSTINFVNPQDIESVEVLKDADATAIYGSRGANGVVLITTKKAKPGKVSTSVNISHGIGQVGHFMKYMNKDQYLQMRDIAFRTANATPPATDFDMTTWKNNPYVDWPDKILGGNAQYTDAQLSFSGGTANTSFSVNGAINKQTTVHEQGYPYDRKSVFFTLSSSSTDRRFSLQLTGNFSSSNQRMPYTDLMTMVNAYPNSPQPFKEDGSLNWDDDWVNPYSYTLVKNVIKSNTLFGSASVSYKIREGITARMNASYNQLQFNDNQQFPYTYYRPALNNTNSSSRFSFNFTNTWNIEPQLNYETKIGNSTVAALAGGTFQQNLGDYNSISGAGYTDINLLGSLAAAATVEKGQYRKTEYRYRGIYLRLNYNWKEKYVVNVTARSDGSSRFAPEIRFRNFWSASGGWVFSNENFVKNTLPFLSFGKLRASYGTVGNDQFNDYRYLDLYSYTNYSTLYQATQGLLPGNLYNPDLQWEETRKLEVGMEAGLFKDRVNFTASWYRNRSGNQVIEYPLPGTTGFASLPLNLGAVVENSGWEFTVNTTNINSRNFKWRTTFNIADQKNKLVAFPGRDRSPTFSRFAIGEPITSNIYFKYMGVDPLTGLYTFLTAGGAVTFAPNGVADRIHNIDLQPGVFGGLGNNFSWKGFELDIYFTFSDKKDNNPLFYNSSAAGQFDRTSYTNVMPEILNAWQKPGDITNIQRLSGVTNAETNAYTNVKMSDYNVVDASYIKLKNLALSWQFTPKMRKALRLQNGRAYVQCQNVFTITRFKGWDPEPSNFGNPSMPPLRVIVAGIQITF